MSDNAILPCFPVTVRHLIGVACLVGVMLTFGNPVRTADDAPPADKIKELKEQRLALLVQLLEAAKTRCQVDSKAPIENVHKAMQDVFAARLDLARTAPDRLKVCEGAVKSAEDWEGTIKKMLKQGVGAPSDLLKVQAYFAETRIALVKAKADSNDKQGVDPRTAAEMKKLRKDRLALAREAYQNVAVSFGEIKRPGGNISILVTKPEEVYTWSIRLLDAERDLKPGEAAQFAALEGHIIRMKELEKKVKLLVPSVIAPKGESEAEWYRLEAQHWLAQAKIKAQGGDPESGLGPVKEITIQDDLKDIRELLRTKGTSGPYFSDNAAERLSAWRAAAEKGSPEAQWFLGRCYENGWGVDMDYQEALKWLRKSADQGFALAVNNVGSFYDGHAIPIGLDNKPAPSRSLEYYRKAAEQGEPVAQINLARYYERGFWEKVDGQQAVKWYTRAAEKNYVVAMRRLAAMYQRGLGVKVDAKEAAKWYRKASDLGDGDSALRLSLMYRYGLGIDQSRAEAKRFLESARQQLGDEFDTSVLVAHLQLVKGAWQIEVKDGKVRYIVTLLLDGGDQLLRQRELRNSPRRFPRPRPKGDDDENARPSDLPGRGQLYVLRPANEANTAGMLSAAGLAYQVKDGPTDIALALANCLLLPDKQVTIEFAVENGKLRPKRLKVLRSKEDKAGLDVKGEWQRLNVETPYGYIFPIPGSAQDFPSYSAEAKTAP